MNDSQEVMLSVLKRREVEQRTGLSRSGLYELMAAESFPKPVRLSARAVGWISHEVDAWIRNRINQRNSTTQPKP